MFSLPRLSSVFFKKVIFICLSFVLDNLIVVQISANR